MASTGSAVAKIVLKYGPQVVKHGPGAVAFVAKFLADHPTLPVWSRKHLVGIADRVRHLRPGDREQIDGKLAIVREEIVSIAGLPEGVADDWLKRAANIAHGANLASRLGRSEQRSTLRSLREQADALLAEVIAAIAYSPADTLGPDGGERPGVGSAPAPHS